VDAPLVGTCALGLGLGLRHALETDHVAAIGTMIADGHGARRAAELGAAWGGGHALAVLGAGAVLLALGVQVPMQVAAGLDLAVALMLAGLGARAIVRSRRAHAGAPPPARPARTPLGAAMIGLVHGASGTAALTLLVLSTIPDRRVGAAFLGIFALGATVAMTGLSALLALPLGAAFARWRAGERAVHLCAGALSIAVAATIALQVARAAP
jgi:hypothetical protein